MNPKKEKQSKTWRKVKLGEILDLIIDHRGKTPKKLGGNWSSVGIPAISAKNIKGGQIVNEKDIRYVSKQLYDKWMPKKLEMGDILLTSEAPLGELLYLKEKVDYCLSQRLFALRVNQIKLFPRFLYYYLLSPKGKHELIRRLSGTAAEGIRQAELRQIEICFPQDINEQRSIASILSAFDDKIELNNKINQNLEQMAQAIFKEWFILPKEGKLLRGWEMVNAEKIFIFKKGVEPGSNSYSITKKTNFVPFYRVRDLEGQTENTDVFISQEVANGKICKPDDVLISFDATVGRIKIGCNGAFSSGIRKVYSKDRFIKNSFIYFWLKTPYVQNTILEHSSGTTILHAGSSIEFLKILFNKDIINKFQKISEPIFNKILEINKENQKLAALRDLLLPKLMSGEIRV